MNRKNLAFALTFLVALVADQATKVWARAALQGRRPIVVVDGYFDLRYSENTGSAFGLLRDTPWGPQILFAFGIVALVVIAYFLRKLPADRARIAAELGLLAGGAIGNLVDRALFGKVTDFIVWKVGQHEWPTFNIADAALVVGVFALLLDSRGEELPGAAPMAGSRKAR